MGLFHCRERLCIVSLVHTVSRSCSIYVMCIELSGNAENNTLHVWQYICSSLLCKHNTATTCAMGDVS